jgi:hypothetical protein
MIREWKRILLIVLQFATWIAGLIVSFVIPPPFDKPDDVGTWRQTQFIVTFCIIVLIIIFLAIKKKIWLWFLVPAACIFLGVAIYSHNLYRNNTDICTCQCFSRTFLIGRETKLEEDKNVRCKDLLESDACDAGDLYTDESARDCRAILRNGFILTVPLYTIAIITILQALSLRLGRQRLQ